MAVNRRKRSVSLPPDLDIEIEAEARREGVTYSRWLADAARNELRVRAGLAAVAEVEREIGSFAGEELAEADEWARETIEQAGRPRASRSRAA
jgi:hypothetical protein